MVVVKLITNMTIVLMTMVTMLTMMAPTCLCGAMEAERGEVTSSTCSTMYWFTCRVIMVIGGVYGEFIEDEEHGDKWKSLAT